jgi:hypothetical protein
MAANDMGPFFIIRHKESGYLSAGSGGYVTPKLYTGVGANAAMRKNRFNQFYEVVPVHLVICDPKN